MLEALWPDVVRGDRQVLLVGGDPGAGKSRLAAEVAIALHRNDVSVLVGACSSEAGLPFDPLVQPVRALLPALDNGELVLEVAADQADGEARDLLRLLTEGSTRGSGPAAGALAPLVFDVVVTLLEAAARVRPLLLVLEDLHWAGESGLLAVRYLVERTAGLPLLVLITHRTSAADRSTLLSEFLADVVRLDGVDRVDLTGLKTDEVAQYLSLAVGSAAPALRPAAAVLRERTGGNPFVLREVWRDLQQRGGLSSLSSGEVSVPESLRAVLTGRLAGLTPRQRHLLLLGAVIGDDFGADLVHAAEGGVVSPEDVYAELDTVAGTGILEVVPGRTGRWQWPHVLARQSVLETSGALEVAMAHDAVGRALEEGFEGEPSRLQRLAHHFASAGSLGTRDKAAYYLELAAQEASRRLAISDAATLYEQAAREAPDAGTRDRLLVAAAREHNLAGHMGRSRELNEEVVTSGRPDQRLAAAIGFEAVSWRTGSPGERAVALLTEAIEAAGADDTDPQVIRARGSLARAYGFTGRRREAMQQLHVAIDLARRNGDDRLLAAVLQRSLAASVGLPDLRGRTSRAEELTEIAIRRGAVYRLGQAATFRNFGAYALGDPASLDQAQADLARMATATQQPFWQWTSLVWRTTMLLMRCQFSAASEASAQSRRLEERFERVDGSNDGPWSLQSFMLRRETGRLGFARSFLDRVAAVENPWRPGVVSLCTELGARDLARSALHGALERDLDRLRSSSSWPAALGFLVEGAVWLEDRDAMAVLLGEAEPYAGLNLAGSELLVAHGSADRFIGMLQSGLGMEGAEQCFEAAVAMDRHMGSPLHEATTMAEYAAHLRRSGAAASRVQVLADAARDMAATYDLHRVRRLLGTDPGPGTGRDLPDGLTAREVEVLRLVGRGHSNRGIADALFISEHTAANHVRSILMKTQCANRTSAAHYAMQHGLLAADGAGGSDDGSH